MLRIINFVVFFYLAFAHAEEVSKKTIELEWEEVPQAGGYEVKLTPAQGTGKPYLFQTVENHISQQVPVGNYHLQIRAKAKDSDDYSEWSESSEIEVVIKEVVPLFPSDQAVIDAKGAGKQEIAFKWSPVDKVKEYTLKVWSEDRKEFPWVFTGQNTHKTLEVPPGRVYYWQVLFASANSIDYAQEPKTFSFALQGPQLLKPEINKYVTGKNLTWTGGEGTKAYKIKLFYRHLDETNWTPLRSEKIEANSLQAKLKAGNYKIEVIATAPRRADSIPATYEFLVKPSFEDVQAALSAL